MAMTDDLVSYNRASLASALRRLATAANEAAADPDDPQLLARVTGRVENVQHARVILRASRSSR